VGINWKGLEKWVGMIYFKALSQSLPERTEEKHGKSIITADNIAK
jgi:hypothetical protein